jgi:hypothetical protein
MIDRVANRFGLHPKRLIEMNAFDFVVTVAPGSTPSNPGGSHTLHLN